MATRLDRVATHASRVKQRSTERERAAPVEASEQLRAEPTAAASVTAVGSSAGREHLSLATLGGAMAGWLALTFALCQVVLPSVAAISGLESGVIASIGYSLPAFALASMVAVVATLVAQPTLRLGLDQPRDPVVAATVGGLGVWALLHNTSSMLVPFADMAPLEVATLVSMNLIEASMLGVMFASFTRRAGLAVALGGGFQLVVVGLTVTLRALV